MKTIIRLIVGLTLLLLCLQGKAQGFFNLTAQEVRIDSVLPTFTYQKSLGSHYADSIYTVSIEYPEFIEMSNADIERYNYDAQRALQALSTYNQLIQGSYGGTIAKTFRINPKGTGLKKLKKGKKSITVKWKKQSARMSASRITGYQIQLATNKKFTRDKKTVTVKGKKYYSPWSKVKTIKTL